ncbi:galactokinase [Bombilactobacillus folatiphilus]|uniref:galactokinase n=1 Tax=Bombilactobacillus folatiphilus TaxID=2923362 RepID=UPI00294FF5FB|nr:galactokinase [Bombilactobacillus folatiphilus]
MTIATLQTNFEQRFQVSPQTFYFAPGRINLIGEHLDYNGGYVLPCAISLGTYAAVGKRDDSLMRVYSQNFADSGIGQIDLQNLQLPAQENWLRYVQAMIQVLVQQGHPLAHGLDILIQGDLPNSSGLSSSASLELLIGTILNQEFQLQIEPEQLARDGQIVENDYLGVNSGMMDQYAIALGQKDQALLLNTKTLTYEYVPLQLHDHQIIIMNTNQPRTLAGSQYNQRRKDCETALKILQQHVKIADLCDLTPAQLDEYSSLLTQPPLLTRVQHAVSENQRVLRAKQVLQQGDLNTFGRLLNASHVSLEQDFEVSGEALDTLVHAAWQQGILGARMTGAGFGGCAIALVPQKQVADFIAQVGQIYQAKMGRSADFYVAQSAAGPRLIQEG